MLMVVRTNRNQVADRPRRKRTKATLATALGFHDGQSVLYTSPFDLRVLSCGSLIKCFRCYEKLIGSVTLPPPTQTRDAASHHPLPCDDALSGSIGP